MKLLLIRHAPAVRNGSVGIRDGERPLTPRGRARFRLAARGLARIAERPDVLLTSPLVRARATADIAAAAFKKVTPRVEPALGQENVDAVVAALKRCPRDAMVAVVGHEPTLSRLLARMLGVHQDDDGPAAAGQLRWFVKPHILRSLGDT